MSEYTIVAVRAGMPRRMEDESPWTSAIFREAVDGPLHLGLLGLDGDGHGNPRVHGGVNKAVCVYTAEHYDLWRKELGVDCGPGWCGENFTVAGQTEDDACLGDIYRVGTATVQISQPRGPCSTLARRWKMPDFPKRVVQTNRSGWYLRVLEEGIVAAGQRLELESRPYPAWTIARVNDVTYAPHDEEQDARAELAAVPVLSNGWRKDLAVKM